MKNVSGLFKDLEDANAAIESLRAAGFDKDQIGVLTDEEALRRRAHRETSAGTVAKDATASAAAGSALGGLTGLLATLVAISIPGFGPALVAGSLAAPLIGGLGGAGIGGLIGALVGGSTDLHVTQEKAEQYAERIRQGGVLVTVTGEGVAADQAESIMEQSGALII